MSMNSERTEADTITIIHEANNHINDVFVHRLGYTCPDYC